MMKPAKRGHPGAPAEFAAALCGDVWRGTREKEPSFWRRRMLLGVADDRSRIYLICAAPHA
jgi:hypothetical protein